MTYNIAYWGSGPISNFHIPALRSAGLEPRIAYSRPDSSRLQEFSKRWNLKMCYNNIDFLNQCKKSDAIVIALETSVTPKALEQIIELDLPVLVEKPGGVSATDLMRFSHHKNAGLLLFGYNRRYYETAKYARNFIAINSTVMIQASFPDAIPSFSQFRINGCHIIDFLQFIAGELILQKAWGSKDPKKSGFFVQLSTAQGHLINLCVNWGAPDNVQVKISNGSDCLVLRGFEQLKHYKGMKIVEPTEEFPLRIYQPIEVNEINATLASTKPGFFQQASAFKKLIERRMLSVIDCSLDQAIHNLEIIDSISESLEP